MCILDTGTRILEYRSLYTTCTIVVETHAPLRACSVCGGCVVGVCGEGSSDMVGYCGAGGREWRHGEGESKVVSGYTVADGEGVHEYEGARGRSEVVTVE